MKVGVPTEIKTDEYRVSLTPAGVRELVEHGHDVIIQAGAGVGSTIPDEEFTAQGARIAPDATSVFDEAEMVLGVKEPQPEEVAMLRPDHLLFTYLHLAPDPDLTRGLVEDAPGVRHDAGALGRVLLVRDRGAHARPGLHDHLVIVLDQLAYARRRERDAVLVRLDLRRHSDLHFALHPPSR